MKSATQLQAEIDRMFPLKALPARNLNDNGYVIVPAHYLASLQEDRALWDAVEAHEIMIEQSAYKFVAVIDGYEHFAPTPREAVAKAVEAIEGGEQ